MRIWHKIKSIIVASLYLTLAFLSIMSVFRIGDMYLYANAFLVIALILTFATKHWKLASKYQWLYVVDFVIIAFLTVELFWVTLDYQNIMARLALPNRLDVMWGIGIFILVLEATRRSIGWPMPVITIFFMLHAWFGNYFPGILRTSPSSITYLVKYIYLDSGGIFGIPLITMATYVIIFLLFASALNATGVGKYFTDLANAITGTSIGGPAKAAVIASGLMGTISGSAVANVVATGTFTIPVMKKVGFDPTFAGATEAVASTGGQIMPPVMGAAAFLIAQFLGISYSTIVFAALIPALLYYFGLFVQVDLRARVKNLPRIESSSIDTKRILRESYLLFPLLALVALISFGKKSVMLGALVACVVTILIGVFHKGVTKFQARTVVAVLETGAKSIVSVTMCSACAGMIIGAMLMSGLGLTLTSMLMKLSGGSTIIALVLAAVCAIVLGMGMPTSSVYLTLSVLVIPFLIKLGVPELSAHMFAFYYGCVCAITPPVALAAYAAASISGANESKTGWMAFRLGFSAYLVPFLFVYRPGILLQGSIMEIIQAIIFSVLGVFFVATGMEGWYMGEPLPKIKQVLFFVAGGALIYPHPYADFLGVLLVIFMTVERILRLKRKNRGSVS